MYQYRVLIQCARSPGFHSQHCTINRVHNRPLERFPLRAPTYSFIQIPVPFSPRLDCVVFAFL